MPALRDCTGERFGKLTVVKREGTNQLRQVTWRCLCDCGIEKVFPACQLRTGRAKSCGCLWKLPEGEAALNDLYQRYFKRAKINGLEFSLSRDEFQTITSAPCEYCGDKPSTVREKSNYNGIYVYNGIDRIDNDAGYVISNVASCCKHCNYAKKDRSVADFIAWAKRIAKLNMDEQEDRPFTPDWYSPTGHTIKWLIEHRKIPVSELAEKLDKPVDWCERLLIGDERIDSEMAGKLADFLGSTQGFWERREATYRKDRKRITGSEE